MNVTTATSRRRLPYWGVLVAALAVLVAGMAVISIGVGSESGGVTSVRVRPLFPGGFAKATPMPADVQSAFATEGLTLTPAAADLAAPRFGRYGSHVVAGFRLAGPSAMLIVVFDRPEPLAAEQLAGTMASGRDASEAAGSVYVEYRLAGLDRATAARVKHAFRLAATSSP